MTGREWMDLGEIDGPMVVFGGPYGNLEATEALLRQIRRLGISPEQCLCTGDVIAYCADPAETIALLRTEGIHVVMGNCEEALVTGSADCGCGFPDGSGCDVLARDWYRYARAQVSTRDRLWMAGLARRIAFQIGGWRCLAVHGGVHQINEFIFPSTPAETKAAQLDDAGVDVIVAGHSGIPFTQILSGRIWHNAGVIGLPPNDGTPYTWYSLLLPRAGGLQITHHRLAYDYQGAALKVSAAGLPEAYARTLVSGLWPDESILPAAERGNRGQPIGLPPILVDGCSGTLSERADHARHELRKS